MPNIQTEVSVAAGASNANIFNGSQFEFLRRPAIISLGVTASVTGGFATVQSGSEVVLEESPPMVQASFPRIPDEMAYNFAGIAGDRLKVAVRNPTGGAIVFRAIAQIAEQ